MQVNRKLTLMYNIQNVNQIRIVGYICLIFLDKNMHTEKHLIELFNDHDYILHSVLYKKQNLTGYIQYYKKMVEQTQRPWVRQNSSSCLTQCQTEFFFFANSAILVLVRNKTWTPILQFNKSIFLNEQPFVFVQITKKYLQTL